MTENATMEPCSMFGEHKFVADYRSINASGKCACGAWRPGIDLPMPQFALGPDALDGLMARITPEKIEWIPPQQPHRCPVCDGRGLVPVGFYLMVGGMGGGTTSTGPETCRSCTGNGIIWGS